jgi:hypothetical protein
MRNLIKKLTCLVIFQLAFNYSHSQAVVSADKMNILYVGVENPVSVAVAGIDAKLVSIKAIGATIRKVDDIHYMISPTGKSREILLMVYAVNGVDTTDYGSFRYRVKYVPQPTLIVAGVASNAENKVSIPFPILQSQPKITCSVMNFLFDISYNIESFTLSYVDDGKIVKETIAGNQIPQSILTNLSQLNKPVDITLTDIKVKDSAGVVQMVTDIIITIN